MGDCLLWVGFGKLQMKLNFFANFYDYKIRVLIFMYKNGLGCILGDFLASSSGHPAPHRFRDRQFFHFFFTVLVNENKDGDVASFVASLSHFPGCRSAGLR
jgi:hypothetical protein